ncbi:hypothetical protein K458DRAFT_422269, partial [Lentithecium fluviatile CBS 122367]
MFSTQDVQDIFRSLPPRKDASLPQLIVSASGDGFITGTSLLRNFERLMTDESERQPLASVSRMLDTDVETIVELAKAHPHLVLLSEKELTVIPKAQRNSLLQHLQDLLAQGLVEISAFIRDNDISRKSLDALVRAVEDDIDEIHEYLLGPKYEEALLEASKARLHRSIQDEEPTDLSPDTLPGRPPYWLIELVFERLIDDEELVSQFYYKKVADAWRLNPKQSVARKRDAVVSQLKSGEAGFLDLRAFTAEFDQLYSYEDAVRLFGTSPDASVIGDYAVSNKWRLAIEDETLHNLDEADFVDCEAKVQIATPQAVKDGIVETLIRHTMEACRSEVLQIQHYVVKSSKYTLERDVLLDIAKAQALSQWEVMKETPDKDVKFQLTDILDAIPLEKSLLRAIAQDDALQTLLAERFSSEISNLESQNEAEFAALWIERVVSRVLIYNEGLDAIEDKKLQGQLAELLSTYLQKELLPDTLAKAQSQALYSSRKTRKNVQKLDTALKAGKKDLAGVQSSIEKFGKKQDIHALDDTSLFATKNTMVGDMIRRMQKPKTDGPLLFLTLILVLFAKHYPGIVYATGKFAPKLLKQLKSKLSAEEYERLENWKELAKSGALSTSDKAVMRQMVEV